MSRPLDRSSVGLVFSTPRRIAHDRPSARSSPAVGARESDALLVAGDQEGQGEGRHVEVALDGSQVESGALAHERPGLLQRVRVRFSENPLEPAALAAYLAPVHRQHVPVHHPANVERKACDQHFRAKHALLCRAGVVRREVPLLVGLLGDDHGQGCFVPRDVLSGARQNDCLVGRRGPQSERRAGTVCCRKRHTSQGHASRSAKVECVCDPSHQSMDCTHHRGPSGVPR